MQVRTVWTEMQKKRIKISGSTFSGPGQRKTGAVGMREYTWRKEKVEDLSRREECCENGRAGSRGRSASRGEHTSCGERGEGAGGPRNAGNAEPGIPPARQRFRSVPNHSHAGTPCLEQGPAERRRTARPGALPGMAAYLGRTSSETHLNFT